MPLALGIISEALAAGQDGDPLFVGASTRWTASHALTDARRRWNWTGKPVRLHDSRTLVADHMASMGVPTEIRSRTLHHTGDLRQLVNTTYSGPYDFMDQRLRALELWERRLLEIVGCSAPSGERWQLARSSLADEFLLVGYGVFMSKSLMARSSKSFAICISNVACARSCSEERSG